MRLKNENCGGSSDYPNGNGEEDCNVEDDFFDPHYKKFLEILKENGNCFVIKGGEQNGTLVILKHEFAEGLGDDNHLDSAGKGKNVVGADKIGKELDSVNVRKAHMVENPSSFDALEKNGRRKSNDKENHCGDKCDREREGCSNVKQTKKIVKEYLGDMLEEDYENFCNCMIHGEGENAIEAYVGHAYKEENLNALDTARKNGRTKSSNWKKERGRKIARTVSKRQKKEALREPGNMIDEDYKYDLDNLDKLERGVLKFNHNGLWVKYEDDSDSEVSIIDCNTFVKEGVLNPFLPSEVICETVIDDHRQCLSTVRESVTSQFREKLLSILKRPYDQSEYNRLSHDIRVRKPIEYNDLQDMTGEMCSVNKKCKSYLDHYSDFRQKLQAAKRDTHKKLNLLRGFFFYLQNITQSGAFIPWTDKSCLAVVPASSKVKTGSAAG